MFSIPTILKVFSSLVFASLWSVVYFTQELLYPFVSPRALWLRAVVLLALPLYFYLVIVSKKFRPNFRNPLTIAVVVFFFANVLSALFGVNIQRSWWGNYERMGGVYHLMHLVILYFYILLLGSAWPKALSRLLQALVGIGSVLSGYGVLIVLKFPQLFFDPSYPSRISVTTGNPIFLASFLIIPMFLSGFFALTEEKIWKRNMYWSLAVLQFIGIFLTGTRGAIVGVVLGLVITGIVYTFKVQKQNKKFSLWGIGGILVVVLTIFALRGALPERSTLKRLITFRDSNSQARLLQWKTALRGFTDRPIVGFGPENYNVVANKYYDRSLYKYDPSWFDKPHNYLLEILVTTGLIGLLSYIAIIIFSVFSVFKNSKSEVLSLTEASVLFSGIMAYQIQNLFVFDTIAASLAFFIFLGFVGYLLEESFVGPPEMQSKKIIIPNWSVPFSGAIFLVVVYCVFVTDIGSAQVLKNINYGYAINIKNPQEAKAYFDLAFKAPFVFDRGELGIKYQDFAVRIAQDAKNQVSPEFTNEVFDSAIKALKPVTEEVNNNAIFWFDLGNLYSQQSHFNKQKVNPLAEKAILKAISLAPNRIEPYYFLVQIRVLQQNRDEAVKISENIVKLAPDIAEAKWRLSLAYKDDHKDEDAVKSAVAALSQGYEFKLVQEFRWLIDYYVDKNQYDKVVPLYEQAVKLSPLDAQLYASLATSYSKVGDKEKAIWAAKKVIEISPESRSNVEKFIQGL